MTQYFLSSTRICGLLGALLLALVAANPASAQQLYVHGGAGFPTSSAFNDAYNTGFNAGVGVGIPLTNQLEGVFMGRYDRFGLDAPSNMNIDGGTLSSLSATANLKLNGPVVSSRLMPYGFAGAGLFRLATSDMTSGSISTDGNSEVDLGLQFGAGLSIGMSPRANLLVEPNYVVVFSEGESTTFFPVRLGVSFGLR